MARMQLDEYGAHCKCGSRQFVRNGTFDWHPGKIKCVGCGRILKPASIRSQARNRRRLDERRRRR